MTNAQFTALMNKLEEIRCGIINAESATEKTESIEITLIREAFFTLLEKKTGWGRNEIKALFDEAVIGS